MNARACKKCNSPLAPDARFCTSCGSPVAEPKAETPTEALPSASRVPRQPMSKQAKMTYALIATCLFGVFAYFFIEHLPGKAHPVIEQQPSVAMATMYAGEPLQQSNIIARVENGKIIIPLPIVLQKKIVAFDYKTETTVIPLLAFINAEGKLVTAIRLCEPCNSRTFSIEGTELACGNCETHWKLNNLEGVQGSCQKYPPDPIPSVVVGNEVQIDEAIVRKWKMRI